MGKKDVNAGFDGALKFPLHSISLILIYYYLAVKTFYEGFTDNNARDEAIGGECSCISNDRLFYQFMFWSSCAVWWISVIITFFVHIADFCRDPEAYADGPIAAIFVLIFDIILLIFSLAIIPFLFLQILDCYQWTCLFSDQFCGDNRDPYRLSLVQSIISICFILSVFAAQYLSSASTRVSTLVYPKLKKNCCGCPPKPDKTSAA